MKKKVLLISPFQYGYHTDMDKYCTYLSEDYDVEYLCADCKLPRVESSHHVTYVRRFISHRLTRLLLIARAIIKIILARPDAAIITYFKGCRLLAVLFSEKHLAVDIRTGNVSPCKETRIKRNRAIVREANSFRHILTVSEGLRDYLGLKKEKTSILPLGADKIVRGLEKLDAETIKLLYIGTFDNRNIEETIKGFNLFYRKYKYDIPCKYTIVGYSDDPSYTNRIKKEIFYSGLGGIVEYKGRIPNNLLSPLYESHNIGVSYIPMKEYFDFQPPTKTFEYLQNGLICIATSTSENIKVINDCNGVLTQDNCFSFFEGLEAIYRNLKKYDASKIMASAEDFTWKRIVNENLKKLIQNITDGRDTHEYRIHNKQSRSVPNKSAQ